MPDQPSWIDRVPEILETLESPGAPPFLDRPTVEMLFGLRRRQAIALLRRFGGYQVGKTFLAPRPAVAGFLRDPDRWRAAAHERGRFEGVRRALGEARQELALRRIAIPARAETFGLEFSGLPAGIGFEPGQLTVAFANPAELLEKLFALAQALGNDYDTFERSWMASQPVGGGR
jgi:hypothetical protein